MQLIHPLEISLPCVVSSQAKQDDARLVKASQHGNQDAFAFLVQRHQRRVFDMVLRMLQDYEEPSEITQKAFFAAYQGLPSFRGEAKQSRTNTEGREHSGSSEGEVRKRTRPSPEMTLP